MADLSAFSKNLDQTYSRLRQGLQKNPRGYEWRMEQLRALKKMIVENDRAISQAMWKDLRKSEFECSATEQGIVLSEIEITLKKLKKWMKPRRASTPLYNQPGTSRIVHEPYGLSLIVGAWNYPINLLLAPLVGAIAGGNASILKPSEMAVATAEVLAQLIPKYMDPDLFAVVLGGPDETGLLLDKEFDTIFFTGSGKVGKIVLAKAAPQLGGKSPAIVMKDADLKVTAHRIVWGKFMNAGQTCIAPDYLLVQSGIKEPLMAEMKKVLLSFYGSNPQQSPDYCRIINERNFDRLMKLGEGLSVIHGGQSAKDDLFIAPTIVNAKSDSPIMQEEIFGPLLPVLEIENAAAAIQFINARPKPLALYLFSSDSATQDLFVRSTSSGSVLHNDVVIHMPEAELPFGGVGPSGMGHYHGEFSFKTFTHAKGVLKKGYWFDLPVRYPPYSPQKASWLKWLFK
jgi:aldehyde dehydrogenase (NAD+)